MSNNIILGTVQLGLPYGVANTTGQPSQELATEIVATALNQGVTIFDTAQAYGVSEQVLGKALRTLNAQERVKIITKIAPQNMQSLDLLQSAFTTSLQNFGVNNVYCLMLHREDDLPLLDQWQGEALHTLQEKGFIQYIGVSVYTPEMALQALEHPLVHIVQIPSSLFDRRFIEAGVFAKANALGKEIHVRSVFLQGVLCMPAETIPEHLASVKSAVEAFHVLCAQYNCTPSQAALAWMRYREPEHFLIFGAESPTQVEENMDSAWLEQHAMQELYTALDAITIPQNPEILNPALWRK